MLFFGLINLNAVISEEELSIIDGMLNEVGLNIDSVNFPKDWGNPAFKLPKVVEILEKPFEYPKFVAEIKERLLQRDVMGFYRWAVELVASDKWQVASLVNATPTIDLSIQLFDENDKDKNGETSSKLATCNLQLATYQLKRRILCKKPQDILKYAEFVYDTAYPFHKEAFEKLSDLELKYLELFVYDLAQGSSDKEKYAFLYEGVDFPEFDDEMEFYIELIQKIDFDALFMAGNLFHFGMMLLTEYDFSDINFKKPVVYNSKFGKMIVGTDKNDVYNDDYVFIFDPKGDDVYLLEKNKAQGIRNKALNTNHSPPFFAIIDLADNDVYKNDSIGGLFSAILGHVFHYDKAGNDFYQDDDLAFSANFGTLISIDERGDDIYQTGAKTLGAATFGIALVYNIGGNDYYSGTLFSQGFGGTLGIGLLANLKGEGTNNTVYHAGGKYPHAPLVPNDYQSLSQGFGFGLRPDLAGGIGILFDEAGNDFYNGGVYSQGVAYWYALGILIDLEGNDHYNAVYYPQGSGIHLAAGFLYDENGDDMYYSRFGPGQGAGHDYGVGFLVDRNGSSSFSVDGGNGLGLANSVGVFVSDGGKNRYERKSSGNYGHANPARESGSIGIFLDLGKDSIFANELPENNKSWVSGVYGLGKKVEMVNDEMQDDAPEDAAESLNLETNDSLLETIAEIFKKAAEWEVGSAVESVKNARKMMLEREIEATDYIFDKKLKTKSGLELRAIEDLAKNSDTFRKRLPGGLSHEHKRAVSNTIYLIGELELDEFIETFEIMLAEDRFVNPILSTLGGLKTEKSVDLLEKYLHSDDIYKRVIVCHSLKRINNERSNNLILSMQDDDCFLIKSMVDLLKK